MARLIKSHKIIELDEDYKISAEVETTKKENAQSALNSQNIALEKNIGESKAQIEKLHQLKERLQAEADEMTEKTHELAEKMLDDANKEAKSILQNANEEAGKLFEQAREEGYSQGKSEALDKFENLMQESRGIVEQAYSFKEQTIANYEHEIVELILQCVSKIIKMQLEKDDQAITEVISSAIQSLQNRDNLIVKVSSDDFNETSKLRSRLLAMYPGLKDIQIEIMEDFKSGDIEVESDAGTVNPSIKNQILKLQTEFKELLGDDNIE